MGRGAAMTHYDYNYSAVGHKGDGEGPETKVQEPSIMPHIGRIISFKRTPIEAWNEYHDEVAQLANESYAVRIQAHFRGSRGRAYASRRRLEDEKVALIQRHVKDKLDQVQLKRRRKENQIASLMAKAERRAVMRLQMAIRERKERKKAAAATIVRAHYKGRKARQELQDQRTQRALLVVMAKGKTKAALRIQYAWWRYRVAVVAKQTRAKEEKLRQQAQKEAAAKRDLQRREEYDMAKPVWKKARSKPLGFQKKVMQIHHEERTLSYCKEKDQMKQPRKVIPLRLVHRIERQPPQRDGSHILVLHLRGEGSIKAGPLTIKYDQGEEQHGVWLKHFREVCHGAEVVGADGVAETIAPITG